jgi:hypothetical protein
MNGNIVAGIVTVAFGGVAFREGAKLPPASFGDPVGAGVFPMFWACVLMALGLLLCVTGVRRKNTNTAPKGAQGMKSPECFAASYRHVCLLFVLLFAQILSIPLLGFSISSILFIPAYAWILGGRGKSLVFAGLAGAVMTAGLYCFFTFGMRMPLPA